MKRKNEQFFKMSDFKKGLLVGGFLALFIFILTLFPTKCEVILPGVIDDLSSEIEILDNESSEINLNSVSVYSVYKPSYLVATFLGVSKKNDIYDITPSYDFTHSENKIMGELEKERSHNYALINAYKLASIKAPTKANQLNYDIIGANIYYSSPDLRKYLPIGSFFDYYNDKKIDEDFYNNLEEIIENDLVLEDKKSNKKVIIKKEDLENNKIAFQRKIKIDTENAFPKYKINDKSYGGPSAGFIQALYIYLSILNIDVENKIAATGTISYNGMVGAIGGLKQKIYTASRNKCDYFLIPYENYKEEKDMVDSLKEKLNLKIIVIKNFNEGIKILKEKGII